MQVPSKGPVGDLVLTNGRIWTGNLRQPWAQAIAVTEGRVRHVGSDAQVAELESGKAIRIDLGGRLALPGFIDAHTHFMDGGFQLRSVNLRDAGTPEEFVRRIAAHARSRPPGGWIVGGDWDPELWPGAPLPTRQMIDGITNGPVFLWRFDGHMALVNSAVLQLAGITKDTPDPPGGSIVRDAATGEPTGVLKESAKDLALELIPEPSDEEYDLSLQASLAEAARHGVTSIHDVTDWDQYAVYRRFHDAGRLTVRIYARTPMEEWQRQREAVETSGRGDEWLRLGGVKAFMDGSLGSGTALFEADYTDEPGTRGSLAEDNLPEGKLLEDIMEADRAGLPCSVHAIGDRANHLLLDYFAEAERKNGPRDRRFRVEHAQHLLPEDISRFGRLGVIASMQPYHAVDDGRWAEKRIGPERAKASFAFRSLLDAGARVVFGSDWTVAPLAPLLGIYAAATRRTLDGLHPHGWHPEQRIRVEEAVTAYTAEAAYAEFAEEEKGTLEPGNLADITVLSKDIFRLPVDEQGEAEVVHTIVGGRVVYSR